MSLPPRVVYLQPCCSACDEDDVNTWCDADVWAGEACDMCGAPLPPALVYVRADDNETEG